MDLSLVVIARDEADRLGRCLDSVDAAEKLVLDGGSRDDTAAVARRHGARVHALDWAGFVVQKNRGLGLARGAWVLSLDADEWLDAEARAALAAAIAAPGGAAGFGFVRENRWVGRPVRGGRFARERKVRVVRRGAGRWAGREPHDHLVVDGPVRWLDGAIGHDPYRSVREHLETADRYATIGAEALRAEGARARWRDVAGRPAWHLVDALVLRGGWRDGPAGLAIAAIGAGCTAAKWWRAR